MIRNQKLDDNVQDIVDRNNGHTEISRVRSYTSLEKHAQHSHDAC